MFLVQELGNDLLEINLINYILQFPDSIRQEICKRIYDIVVVPSNLYKIMETLNWCFSWFLH
jgi:hypothetical protein